MLRTQRAGCELSAGDEGSHFDINTLSYKSPGVVSSTNGIGTKLKAIQPHMACMKHEKQFPDISGRCLARCHLVGSSFAKYP